MRKNKTLWLSLINYIPLALGLATVFLFREIFMIFPLLQIPVLVLDICLTSGKGQFGIVSSNFAASTIIYLVLSGIIHDNVCFNNGVLILLGNEATWMLFPVWIIAILTALIFKKSN